MVQEENQKDQKENNSGCGVIGIIILVLIVVFSIAQALSNPDDVIETGLSVLAIAAAAAGIRIGYIINRKTARGWLAILSGLATTVILEFTITSDDEVAFVVGAIVTIGLIIAFAVSIYLSMKE